MRLIKVMTGAALLTWLVRQEVRLRLQHAEISSLQQQNGLMTSELSEHRARPHGVALISSAFGQPDSPLLDMPLKYDEPGLSLYGLSVFETSLLADPKRFVTGDSAT